jgi:hypothetical protein
VLGQQLADVAAQLHPGGGEQDEVVGDPFHVGDQMRGQDDRQAAGRDRIGQRGQELPPGQRVERRHRLIQQQQPGPFGQRQRQGQLCPLATGQRACGPVQRDVQRPQPVPGRGGVPARVEMRADGDVILGGEPPVQRDLLGQETDLGQERGVLAGRAAEHRRLARGRPGQPGQQP